MNNPIFYAAVFAIIRDEEGKILFQKRSNTGYRDGFYQLPSGHIEQYEGMHASVKREVKEEINIDIIDMNLKHITQWINLKGREYFNVYFEVLDYEGVIKNLEIDKCSELYWATREEINTNKLFEKDREILDFIDSNISFSETSPSDGEPINS